MWLGLTAVEATRLFVKASKAMATGTVKFFNDEKGFGFISKRTDAICSFTSPILRALVVAPLWLDKLLSTNLEKVAKDQKPQTCAPSDPRDQHSSNPPTTSK